MSYSSVCQGLQSCFEPCVLNLKLAPPGPSSNSITSSLSFIDFETNEKPLTNTATMKSETGGSTWSFIQSLCNISHCNKTENVYVHPSVKHSSSMLSAESLELCTESLGCETGSSSSNASDNNTDDMSLFSFESTKVVKRNPESKRLKRTCSSFPPPLTSITDFGGFQVRSHREDGRLILEAVTSSSSQPYFQAERGNGRLRLRLFESVASCCDDEVDDDEHEGEEVETFNQQEAWGEEEEEEEEEEELEDYVGNVEDEMGMTKFARPSRCKESGNRDIFGDGYFELPSLSLCL